jgi:heme o synthase
MERNSTHAVGITERLSQAVSDFGLLVKFRLSLLVLFSAVMSYAIVSSSPVSWSSVWLLTMGGFLVTGAANALNQALEKDYDRQMARTAGRPIPAGRMSVSNAVLIAGLMALAGISMLSVFNPLTGFIGTLSLISYAFIYTPLKRSTPFSVAVGAVPGALPIIIGCVAFEGRISQEAFMLFMLQFLWQFPHFWAVAWLADEDYKKAGFYLLPSKSGEKDASIGLVSLLFCVAMMVNVIWGYQMGFYSIIAAGVLQVLNIGFAYTCLQLYRQCNREAARKQMFASFAHLPFSLIAILLDKTF